MKQMLMKHDKQTQAGFSLLETMLAVTILVALFMGGFAVLRTYTNREVAKAIAGQMQQVRTAMRTELSDVRIFDAYFTEAAGLPLQVNLDAAVPCAVRRPNLALSCTVGGVNLPIARSFFAGNALTNARNNNLSIILVPMERTVPVTDPNAAYFNGTLRSFEIFVVVNAPQDIELVNLTAQNLGAAGGRIQDPSAARVAATQSVGISGYTNRANTQLRSVFGSWRTTGLGVYAGGGIATLPWFTGLPGTMPNDQGVTALYDFMTRGDAAGDVLYRTAQTSAPLNTMYTDMDLGNNNLVGADHLAVNGNLNVNGQAFFKGGTVTGSTTAINGTLQAIKPNATGNVARFNGLSGFNNVNVQGDANLGDLDVNTRIDSNAAIVSGTTNVNSLSTNDTVTTNSSLSGFDKINATTALTNNAGINVNNTLVTQTVMSAGGGAGRVPLPLNNKDAYVQAAPGVKSLTTPSITTTGDLWIRSQVTLDVFGNCAEGCD